MRINFLKHGASILVLVLFGFLALGSGTAEKAVKDDGEKSGESKTPEQKVEINYKAIPLADMQSIGPKEGEGIIVEAYICSPPPFNGSITLSDTPAVFDNGFWRHQKASARVGILADFGNKAFGGYGQYPLLNNYIDFGKLYSVYLIPDFGSESYDIANIDGLMTKEETAGNVARQKEAERLVKEEERKALEEANRYDPAKFIIVPANFKPTEYTKTDLFDAVAASEKLNITAQNLWGEFYTPSKQFVSDVVFVSQNGTDIIFKTSDNAITKMMKVDARTGLTAGQKVRIYYTVYRIEAWRVRAIEKL